MKKFKVLNTNLTSFENNHFECTTPVGSHSEIYGESFRCVMFDGLKVKLANGNKYILGEIHG